ncbi:uncharacterized protein LOC141852824 isoform X2 [Brevipalpus obovatus]
MKPASVNNNYGSNSEQTEHAEEEFTRLCHQLAAEFVQNVIKLASAEAASKMNKQDASISQDNNKIHKQARPTDLNHLNPSIQIDLVGSRTPSPEEETFSWVKDAQKCQVENNQQHQEQEKKIETVNNDSNKKQVTVDVRSDVPSPQKKITSKSGTREDPRLEEIQQFAKQYVKDIVSKAIILASEREATYPSLKSELSYHRISRTSNLSWLERIRQFFRRFISRACLCKTKHNSVDSFHAN